MPLRFLDTNILLYSISRDPTEAAKRDRAVALIDADGLRFVGPGCRRSSMCHTVICGCRWARMV